MANLNSQKFVGRNRAPRVQIEYDVELYGSEKKIELPFIMGVMADLSGKPADKLPDVADRKFHEIDQEKYDARLNTVGEGGKMSVELSFESMEDFSPAAIARKVDSLNKLLTARNELSNLLTYMDGKSGAEDVLNKLMTDPALRKALAAAPKPTAGESSPAA